MADLDTVDKVDEIQNGDHSGDERPQILTRDGASPGKIFIGGLAKDTTPTQFSKYFGKYGEITDSVIMKDRRTGQPRGFGFVTYADPLVVDKVIQDVHIINGKQVEIKRTIPRVAVGSRDFKTRKIFVGGIPTTTTEDEFRQFFAKFGEVKEHEIIQDHSTNRSRGFGFITFDSEHSVDDILAKGNKIEFAGTQVEIKKAEPKKPLLKPPPSRHYSEPRPAYGGWFGDGYGGFGASTYRSGRAYSGRLAGRGGYGGSEFGAGYRGTNLGPYRGEASYSSRYEGSFGRGYSFGAYGGVSDGYVGYDAVSGGYGGGYDGELGGRYEEAGGSYFGGRGSYGGGGRYHPYMR